MTKILPKTAFVLSVGVLGFAYGFAAEAWNLFPKAHVEQAWRQARARFDVGEQPSEMCPIPVPCSEKCADQNGDTHGPTIGRQLWM